MKTIRIGRDPGNDRVVSSGVVSGFHAVITISDDGRIYIRDCGSTNGTFVDGRKITGHTLLEPASKVLLGNHQIDWKSLIRDSERKGPVSIPPGVVDKKLIGRSPLAQVRFSFDDVSDKHAWLCRHSDGTVLLIDNNSTNGTFVNGARISAPTALRKGDIVTVSKQHPINWETVYPPKPKVASGIAAAVAAAVILVAVLFVWKPWDRGEKDWSEIYAQHKNDVVLIYVKSAYRSTVNGSPLSSYLDGYDGLDYCYIDSDGDVDTGISASSGTGFFISSDGKFLTNRHVVSQTKDELAKNEATIRGAVQSVLVKNKLNSLAAGLEVKYTVISIGIVQNDTFINSENDLISASVLKVSDNEELDVALLQTNSKTLPAGATVVDLSKAVPSDKLKIGCGICTIGFPKSFIIGQTSSGLEANNQSGEITQERGTYEYGHNITIHQGASGSPVYDKKGRFAGIIVSGFLGISQGYNHAVQPTPVVDFVGQYR